MSPRIITFIVASILSITLHHTSATAAKMRGGEMTMTTRDSLNTTERWWPMYSDSTTKFRATQFIAPGVLFTIGALGIGENAPLREINLAINNGMYKLSKGKQLYFDDYIQFAPLATYLALCATPIKSKHSAGERIAIAAITYMSMAILTNSLKYTIREMRPSSSRRNSFPSGHTANAFAGAELVRTEYGWSLGLAAYAVASSVAFMRLYNNRHWFNDVLGGAAIGIISARIGYWLLPLSRKIFKLKPQSVVAVSPSYFAEQEAIGVACAISF